MRAQPETPPMLEKKSLAVYIANIFEILFCCVYSFESISFEVFVLNLVWNNFPDTIF